MHAPRPNRARTRPAALTAIAAVAAALGLSACDRADENRPVAQRTDEAAQRAEQRADQAGERAREAGAEARQEAREAGAEARQEAREAGTEARNMVGDATITASVNAQLARDNELSALKIDVDTVDGRVALKGTAPSAEAKERATQIAQAVDGVRGVDNQLVVKSS